jgi:hypothetical protein
MPNVPETRVEGDVLVLTWPDVRVRAEVEQLRRERGDLIGEATWYIEDPAQKYPHLHGGKLNMSSTRERASLVKYLSERTDGVVMDWATLVEQVSVLAKRHHQEGEPFVKIGLQTDAKPHKYRLDRLLEEGQITVLYGEGGTGKSYIALAAGLSVQEGFEVLGLDMEPGNVGYLDYETDAEEQNDRLRRLCRGLTMLDIPELHYRRMTQPIADDVGRIRRFISQENIKLVIIDSLGLACGGEPESAEVALRMYGALRQLGCTVLGIHHVSAAQTEQRGKRRPFGSIYHVNIPRSTWEVRSTADTESNTMRLALYHRKCNNGRLWKAIGYELTFQPDATLVKRTDPMDVRELAEGVSLADQIAAALKHGRMTVAALAEEINTSESNVRVTFHRNKNRFRKVGDAWELPSDQAALQ